MLVLENRDRVDPVRPWRVTLGDRVLSCEPRWALGPGVDPRVEPFTTHAGALIDATAGGAEAAPSMRDALDAHLVADALARSSESGRRESVRR